MIIKVFMYKPVPMFAIFKPDKMGNEVLHRRIENILLNYFPAMVPNPGCTSSFLLTGKLMGEMLRLYFPRSKS